MRRRRHESAARARWLRRASVGTFTDMTAKPQHLPGAVGDPAALDEAIRGAIGYRVVGPDGDLGAVVGVPEAGRPPRPLVLVVRDEHTVHLVSLQRVVAVLPSVRVLLLGPGTALPPDSGVAI
jgi:hypothetical protein